MLIVRTTGFLAVLFALFASPFVIAADVAVAPSERLGGGTSSRRDDPAASLQLRIKDQVAKGISIDAYAVALAQAWLDYGRESYFRKDRRAFREALDEANAVIDAIDRQGTDAKVNARILPSSSRLRDDLWLKAAELKQHAEFGCAAWHIARMEIALVAAGRANNDMGWRAARPFVQRAERFAKEADRRFAECAAPKHVAKPSPTARETPLEPNIVAAPVPKMVESVPTHSLPDRVHFARESAEISDVSALVLEQVSYVMRANPVVVLELRGYAEELTSIAENEKLALARALAVRDYLVETGVGKERVMVKPDSAIVTDNLSALERAKRRRVELVPTQSESIPIQYQDKDLSAEGPPGQ